MESKWSKSFWNDTIERCIYTMCETAIASLGVQSAITDVDWLTIGSTAVLSGVVTFLKCILVNTQKEDEL